MAATKLKPVDVVVVGSGVVGSIMSMELASAGLTVVCLERGKQFDIDTDFQKPNVYDELKFDRHSDIFDKGQGLPSTPQPIQARQGQLAYRPEALDITRFHRQLKERRNALGTVQTGQFRCPTHRSLWLV